MVPPRCLLATLGVLLDTEHSVMKITDCVWAKPTNSRLHVNMEGDGVISSAYPFIQVYILSLAEGDIAVCCVINSKLLLIKCAIAHIQMYGLCLSIIVPLQPYTYVLHQYWLLYAQHVLRVQWINSDYLGASIFRPCTRRARYVHGCHAGTGSRQNFGSLFTKLFLYIDGITTFTL